MRSEKLPNDIAGVNRGWWLVEQQAEPLATRPCMTAVSNEHQDDGDVLICSGVCVCCHCIACGDCRGWDTPVVLDPKRDRLFNGSFRRFVERFRTHATCEWDVLVVCAVNMDD